MIEDNMISKSSVIYAQALNESAKEKDIAEKICEQLTDVCKIIESSEEFQTVIHNPAVPLNKKFEIIDEVFNKVCDKCLLNFIKILIEKGRLCEIKTITSAYYDLLNKELNKKNIEVVSACELDKDKKNTIEKLLNKKFNADVNIIWQIDKTIMAGLVFKYDDKIIDMSLTTKLNDISKNLLR